MGMAMWMPLPSSAHPRRCCPDLLDDIHTTKCGFPLARHGCTAVRKVRTRDGICSSKGRLLGRPVRSRHRRSMPWQCDVCTTRRMRVYGGFL